MAVYRENDYIANRYRVEKVLGRGGMGLVYLVNDQLTNQRLALKTLLPQYVSNERAVQRFVREVTAVRQLDHPCIVKVFDAGKVDGSLYYTMEYIEGKSLRTLLTQRKRLGMGSTVRILSLVCSALEHAHKVSIHRDLSPDNVMVLPDGHVKLLDFGLAKLTNTDAAFTRIGVSLGKAQYNAPEQRANAAEVDRTADIYSLGVMFFEMLTGKLPKGGQRITDFRPDLPKDCNDFLDRAMAPLPAHRIQTAETFRQELVRLYALYQEAKRARGSAMSQPTGAPAPLAGRSVSFWSRLVAPLTSLFRRKR